jgi:hypothetical protein
LPLTGAVHLRTDVKDLTGEVNVVPQEAEQLAQAHAGEQSRGQCQPVARRSAGQQPLHLVA